MVELNLTITVHQIRLLLLKKYIIYFMALNMGVALGYTQTAKFGLLFGVNEKLLTQHILGPVTRARVRAWARVRARAKG